MRELPLTAKVAAFLSFLAVVAALIAPAALLAADLRTGKLGGLCSTTSSLAFGSADDAAADESHCDLCSLLSIAIAPIARQILPSRPDQIVSRNDLSLDLLVRANGPPPIRGPPAH